MTRIVVRGGRVFDGTGADPAEARRRDRGRPDRRRRHRASTATRRSTSPGGRSCPACSTATSTSAIEHVDPLSRARPAPFSLPVLRGAAGTCWRRSGSGITTVREAGGADLGVKQAVEDGLIPGPRMQISIIMLSQTGGHGDDW